MNGRSTIRTAISPLRGSSAATSVASCCCSDATLASPAAPGLTLARRAIRPTTRPRCCGCASAATSAAQHVPWYTEPVGNAKSGWMAPPLGSPPLGSPSGGGSDSGRAHRVQGCSAVRDAERVDKSCARAHVRARGCEAAGWEGDAAGWWLVGGMQE
eukprot:366558-Chlamydomonas_euryale.AAC.30